MNKYHVITCLDCGQPWSTTRKTTRRCRRCNQVMVAAWKANAQRDRLLRLVADATAEHCIEWNGYKELGYGRVALAGRHDRPHRIMFGLVNGNIPNGLFVLHRCDNRACINPLHLFLGTNQDNMTDMVEKGRSPQMIGERNGHRKLSEDDVRVIRKSPKTGAQIARDLGVSTTTVSSVRRGNAWRHVA